MCVNRLVQMATCSYTRIYDSSLFCGYHEYGLIRNNPIVGEELACHCELGNSHNPYEVTYTTFSKVILEDKTLMNWSAICWSFTLLILPTLQYHTPYSGKLSRTTNYPLLADLTATSKINPSKSYDIAVYTVIVSQIFKIWFEKSIVKRLSQNILPGPIQYRVTEIMKISEVFMYITAYGIYELSAARIYNRSLLTLVSRYTK